MRRPQKDPPKKMRTCLAHPKLLAEFWIGHVHVTNRSHKPFLAGWCGDCDFMSQHVMYVKDWKRCSNCCGTLGRYR